MGKTTDAAAVWGNLLPRCWPPPVPAASASSTPSMSWPRPHSSAVRAASLYLVSCLISTRSWVRIPVGVLSPLLLKYWGASRLRGGIGRHRDLKSRCLRACGFESRRRHHSIAIQTLTTGFGNASQSSSHIGSGSGLVAGLEPRANQVRLLNSTAHSPCSYRVGSAEGTHARSQTIHERLQAQRQVGVNHPHHIPVGEERAKLLVIGVEDDVLPRHH